MTYSDNNPERRNLTILSLAIIVFYLGEGYLLKSELSFTLVNIGFKNQAFLVVFVWVMLFWFLFRYVVTNRHTHGIELEDSAPTINMYYAPVIKYMTKMGHNQYVNKLKNTRVFCNASGDWYLGFPNAVTHLTDLDGYLIIKLYLLKIIFKHRATTDYYTPYLLFLFAVVLGLYTSFIDVTNLILVLILFFVLAVVEVFYYIRN